jgi:hypothetical protein
MVERRFADDLESSAELADQINRINSEEGVRWLYSFLSADKRKTYCLYEAPFADAIRNAAQRAGLPADAVQPLDSVLLPDGSQTGLPAEFAGRMLGRGIQPAPRRGHHGGLGPVRRSGLGEDAAHVVSGRVLGDPEPGGDLAVAAAFGE